MTTYDDRPWLARYDAGQPADITPPFTDALSMFHAAAAAHPQQPLIHYFDRSITMAEADEASDALAAGLVDNGFGPGDRLAVYLQNVPQFALAMLATWKAGGIMVSINPMNKTRELEYLLTDSGASVLVTLESLWEEFAGPLVAGGTTAVRVAITTNELDYLAGAAPPLLAASRKMRPDGTFDLLTMVAEHAGESLREPTLGPDDVAFLTYTSGTTGPPKGAMNTHGNVVFNSTAYRDWMSLTPQDSVLGVAPLFHITGLIAHLTVAFLVPMPIVLGYRFDPATVLDLIERYRPTFTVGAITVFIALMNDPSFDGRDLSSLTKVYSGGAPIAPSVVERFEKEAGSYIHNIYGLTETTSPSHGVPMNARAPVDPTSGALSVGVPIYNTVVRVVDDDGMDVPIGDVGEFVTIGPQDRKKDMINAAGYKVWPREVEDVLYQHPAVLEAAVIGIPDEYRGETVKAFVSLRAGQSATEAELIAFCKDRMAAYKYPRTVELVVELPKTATGKILRRELRDAEASKGG